MTEETPFKNRTEALRHLQAQGFKIKKSKLYKDAKAGELRVEPDGTITALAVQAYAGTLNKKGEISPEKAVENADRKQRAEIRKIERQTEKIEFDLAVQRGKYILRDQAEMERIGLLGVLDVQFRQLINVKMAEWCRIMSGRTDQVETVRRAADGDIDEMFNSLARSDGFEINYEWEVAE